MSVYGAGEPVNGYAIAVGGKGKMFTLRRLDPYTEYWEYVCTLGNTPEVAEAKAFKKTGLRLKAPDTTLGKRADRTPDELVRFERGKHAGELLLDVLESDIGYIVWIVSGDDQSLKHNSNHQSSRIIKLARKHPLYLAEKERREKAEREERERAEREKREREERAEFIRENSEFVGTVGERMDFICTIEKVLFFDTRFGTRVLTIMLDEDSNRIAYWNFLNAVAPNGEKLSADEGDKVSFSASVKEHSHYNGVKQTTLSRATKGKYISAGENTMARPERRCFE